MVKAFLLMFLFFNLLACDSSSQTSMKNSSLKKTTSFICLQSQNLCEISTEYGLFSVTFSAQEKQRYIHTELPFKIQVSFNSINSQYQLRKVSSFLEGKDMFMGKIPVFFEQSASDNSIINHQMIANSLLASCSNEIMTWRLWFQVEILADEVIHQQEFFIEFDSKRL